MAVNGTVGIFSIRRKPIELGDRELMQILQDLDGRQDNKCGCCQVSMGKAVGVIIMDGDGSNTQPGNFVAACKVCEALHNGGRVNTLETAGYLVRLPSLTQIQIIQLAHAQKAVTRTRVDLISMIVGMRQDSRTLARSLDAEIGFSDVDGLATLLSTLSDPIYKARSRLLGPVRWWPDVESQSLQPYMNEYAGSFLADADMRAVL